MEGIVPIGMQQKPLLQGLLHWSESHWSTTVGDEEEIIVNERQPTPHNIERKDYRPKVFQSSGSFGSRVRLPIPQTEDTQCPNWNPHDTSQLLSQRGRV